MDLGQLSTFLAVAEMESLTRAAQKLHLSQPTVSGHVRALEQDWGVTLFHRTGRGVKLTSAGEQLLGLALDVVTRVRTLESRAAQLRGEATGTLRLGSIDCGIDLGIATAVGRLRQRHPDVRVDFSVQTSGENVSSLLRQELDVAFVEGTFDESRLALTQVGVSHLGIVGPSAFRDRVPAGDWAKLAEMPWLLQGEGCSYCSLLADLGRKHHVTFTPEFRSEMFGAIRELVAEGLAFSLVDIRSVQSFLDSGRVFLWGDFSREMPVSLACLRQRRDEPTISCFHDVYRPHSGADADSGSARSGAAPPAGAVGRRAADDPGRIVGV